MHVANRMAQLVQALLAQHPVATGAGPIDLTLTMAGHGRLTIQELPLPPGTKCQLMRVSLCPESPEGALLPDPAILYVVTGVGDWMPLEITRILGGHWIVGILHPKTGTLYIADTQAQAALAAYADLFAYNLHRQGWSTQAQLIASVRASVQSRL